MILANSNERGKLRKCEWT